MKREKRIIGAESWAILLKEKFVVPRLNGEIVDFPFGRTVYAYNEQGEKVPVKCTSTKPVCIRLAIS